MSCAHAVDFFAAYQAMLSVNQQTIAGAQQSAAKPALFSNPKTRSISCPKTGRAARDLLNTASEADAVTGFLVRGASQYDTIPRREKKNTATKPTRASNRTTQKQNKGKQKHHKNQNITKWNDISKSNDET